MRRLALAAALLPAVLGAQATTCKWKPTDAWVKRQAEFFDDSKGGWTDDDLRHSLLAAAGLTEPLKIPVSLGAQIFGRPVPLGRGAQAMVDQLTKLAAERGSTWPTKSVVGAAGTHAVYLLTQLDTTFARAALHRMMEAGPAESPAIDVAMLEDRLRIVSGRKQIYGTQFRLENYQAVLSPMEDSAHADLRREDAGLPPFRLGLCFAKSLR